MQLDPSKTYVACALADGRRHWSTPLRGDCCNSINVKRTTIEEIGLFLAGLAHYDLRLCESVEVYELTAPALVMQLRDEAGRLIVEH